jgi:hypothetical protein
MSEFPEGTPESIAPAEKLPNFRTFGDVTKALGFQRVDDRTEIKFQEYEREVPSPSIGPIVLHFSSQQHRFSPEERLFMSASASDLGVSVGLLDHFIEQAKLTPKNSNPNDPWFAKDYLRQEGYVKIYLEVKKALELGGDNQFLPELQIRLLEKLQELAAERLRIEEVARKQHEQEEQDRAQRKYHEELHTPNFFDRLTAKVRKRFPGYTGVDNEYQTAKHIYYYGPPREAGDVPVLDFSYHGGDSFNIWYGVSQIRPDGTVDSEYFNNTHPTILPQPRRTLEWENMHWEDGEVDLALEKLGIMQKGVTLTSDVLQIAIGWSESQDKPITFGDFISYHHKRLADQLGIPPSSNYNDLYMKIYPRGIRAPEQLKKAAIENMQRETEPVTIDGQEYDPMQLVHEIETGTELGTKVIDMLKNRVSAYEELLKQEKYSIP